MLLAKHLQDRLVAGIRGALLSGNAFPIVLISERGIAHRISVERESEGLFVGGQEVDGQFYRFYLVNASSLASQRLLPPA